MLTLGDIKATILGHAIGDALGVPVEFQTREELRDNPVVGMCGYGTYPVPAGAWSDDTSMTLALVESLARLGNVDYVDIMRNFIRWADEAEFTPTGVVFDMGHATMQALMKFAHGTAPLDCGGKSEYDNGNGSLMRIAPLALWLYGKQEAPSCNAEAMEELSKVSSLTHAHAISRMACGIYGCIVAGLLAGQNLGNAISSALEKAHAFYGGIPEFCDSMPVYSRLWDMNSFALIEESKLKSSGYVVDTLEAAIWCLLQTESYKECVLLAVNLGEDTDTVAAIAGGLAGLAYGANAIPEEWLNMLIRREYIEGLCEEFYRTVFKEE